MPRTSQDSPPLARGIHFLYWDDNTKTPKADTTLPKPPRQLKYEVMDYGTETALTKVRTREQENRNANPPRKISRTAPDPHYSTYPMRAYDGRVDTAIYWPDTPQHVVAGLSQRITSTDDPENHSNLHVLTMPPGFGKTAISVATAGEMQRHRKEKLPLVIVTAAPILKRETWQATVASWNAEHPENTLDPYLITSYTKFSNLLEDPNSARVIKRLLNKQGLIIIDELHAYKTPTSKRSKQMQKLRDVHKLGVTATPINNDPAFDIGSYLILAGYYRNKTDFIKQTDLQAHLDRWGNADVYTADGEIDVNKWPAYETLMEQMKQVVYAPDVEESTADMPNVSSEVIHIKDSDDLRRDIQSLSKAYEGRVFDSMMDYLNSLNERIYSDTSRLDEIARIVQQKEVTQPLIFYHHTQVKNAIVDHLNKQGIATREVSGDHSIADFDNSFTGPVLIQYLAGGVGVEFKQSNASIFAQTHRSYTVVGQARGRNVRRGMKHHVTHYYLVCEQEYDQIIFEKVNNREEVSYKILKEIVESTLHNPTPQKENS